MAWLILIKPVAWAFICIPVILILQFFLARTQPYKQTAALFAGFILIAFSGAAYRYDVHQQWTSGSFLGNQLIGKLAFTEFDPRRSAYPSSAEHWLELMEEPKSLRTEHMDTLNERFIFSLNIYDYLRFRKMPEILAKSGIEEPQHATGSQDLAFSIVRQSPGGYLEDVVLHFWGLWTLGELQSEKVAQNYNAKLSLIEGRLPDEITPYRLEPQSPIAYFTIKGFLLIAAITNIVILFLGLRQLIHRLKPLPETGLSLVVVACMIQSYFLLTALLQAGLMRYAIAAWPLHLVIVVVGTVLFFDYCMSKKTRRRPNKRLMVFITNRSHGQVR